MEREARIFYKAEVMDLDTGLPMTNFKLAITHGWDRPEVWIDPIVNGDMTGLWMEGLAPGVYAVWAKWEGDGTRQLIPLGEVTVN